MIFDSKNNHLCTERHQRLAKDLLLVREGGVQLKQLIYERFGNKDCEKLGNIIIHYFFMSWPKG